MKKIIYIMCLIFLQYSCSSDNSGTDEPNTPDDPTSANLIFPYESSLCNEGTNITPTQSTVLFEWGMSANTDNYTVQLKNISTGNLTSHQTSGTQIPIVLDRATQYEWYVVSQSNSVTETAQSDVWQFYNAGEATQNYAPFPAEIVSPFMAETVNTTSNEITLVWNGNDVDDDIVGYDVYFGTSTPPGLHVNDLAESSLVVSVSANIYYWKIITKDAQGNTSDSGVYQFRIE